MVVFREDTSSRVTQQIPGITADNLRQVFVEPLWLLPVVDVVMAFLAWVLAYTARYELQLIRPVLESNTVPFSIYMPYVLAYTGWLLINYATGGLYRRIRGRSFFEEATIIANGVTNAIVLIMAVSFMLQVTAFSRLMLVYLAVITIVLLAGVRLARRWAYAYLRSKRGIGVQRVLIVGAGEVGQAVLRVMLARSDLGYRPVGHLDDNPAIGDVDLGRLRGLGSIDNLEDVIASEKVDLVVVTLPWTQHNRIMQIVDTCKQVRVATRVVPDVFQLNLRQLNVENLDGIPLLGIDVEPTRYVANRLIKRALDLTLVTLAAPVWVPVFGIVALLIKLDGSGGSIFYSQRRVGENGRMFDMYKFRSMVPDADKLREKLVREQNQDPRHPKIFDDPRITPIGRIIRRTSMDELPNLINVITGQMSLVGPRPPTPDEVDLYDKWHMQRLNTVPGVTGLWQVSGRSHVPFDEMVLLDIYYIENWSIWLDLEIIMRTIPRVLLRDGAF
ncbi:MAG: sugar transferase [Chloroflexota bacterium]